MTIVKLHEAARQDRREEVLYYRREAGAAVSKKLLDALAKAQMALAHNPSLGSPVLGKTLGLDGLRTWIVEGFPLSFWYVERRDHIDVIRLLGHRRDEAGILRETRLSGD
jgi:toxin ParE1/3/4